MFRELYDLSQHVGEVLPPIGYGLVECRVEVNLDPPMTFRPCLTLDVKGKERLGEKFYLPDFVRSSNHRPLIIADTADYVLGLGKQGGIRHSMYLDLLKECLEETQDEAVKAAWQAVQIMDAEAIRKGCSPWFDQGEPLDKARMIFLYKGELITDHLSVQKFWKRKFTELTISWETGKAKKKRENKISSPILQASREGVCTITGDRHLLVGPTLPVMIKGVPSTQGKGAALMSFNCESFESRQWKDSEHAPLGFEVAERSHQMLNHLLRQERHSYKQGKSKFVYWGEYDTGLNPDIWDDSDLAPISISRVRQ
jgi:CRISPR-associated protein Csd1